MIRKEIFEFRTNKLPQYAVDFRWDCLLPVGGRHLHRPVLGLLAVVDNLLNTATFFLKVIMTKTLGVFSKAIMRTLVYFIDERRLERFPWRAVACFASTNIGCLRKI